MIRIAGVCSDFPVNRPIGSGRSAGQKGRDGSLRPGSHLQRHIQPALDGMNIRQIVFKRIEWNGKALGRAAHRLFKISIQGVPALVVECHHDGVGLPLGGQRPGDVHVGGAQERHGLNDLLNIHIRNKAGPAHGSRQLRAVGPHIFRLNGRVHGNIGAGEFAFVIEEFIRTELAARPYLDDFTRFSRIADIEESTVQTPLRVAPLATVQA